MSKKNKTTDKLMEFFGATKAEADAKREATAVVTEEEVVETQPTVLDKSAVDLIKLDNRYKRVYIKYNLETGEAKVEKVVTGNTVMEIELSKVTKFITKKLMLNKEEME